MTELDPIFDDVTAEPEADAPPKRTRRKRASQLDAFEPAAMPDAPTASRSDSARWAAVGGLAVVAIIATAAAPHGLRRIDAFRIDHVEIYGNHYMTAEQVLKASHITKHASVFDDVEQFRAALLSQPLIATATVQRRLPNTAIVRITETHPVAFARTPELRSIDANGRILPADPTSVDMDLPIISTDTRVDAHGRAIDGETVKTAAVLGRLLELEPVLARWVSEATPMRDGVRLSLRGPSRAEVLLPYDIDENRLRELRITLADLAVTPATALLATNANATNANASNANASTANATGPSAATAAQDTTMPTTGLGYVTRIDVRYAEQVVVSLHMTGTH